MSIQSRWEKPLYPVKQPTPDELSELTGKLHLDSKQSIQESPSLRKVRWLKNVHADDIHAMIQIGPQEFVSGSKDGSLKEWDFKTQHSVTISSPPYIDYKNWITALAPLNEDHWLSGTRNGQVIVWNKKSKDYSDLQVQHGPYPQTPNCKQRNIHRVNCLSPFSQNLQYPTFFVGWPTQFTEHSMDKRVGYTHTSENDWVYVIEPISTSSALVVTGCRLDLYVKRPHWKKQQEFIKDNSKRGEERPFISAVTPLKGPPSHYGLAVFDGSVQVYNIEANKLIFRGNEHKNRVWIIENIRPFCFASCADDGLIKLWDVRQKTKSLCSVIDNDEEKSRVSILKLLNENELLSGSCPDNVRKSATKAQFSFWDLRRLS